MKQQEKSALARQRILDAAMEEFAERGYEGASLNTAWAKYGISKGSIYHHFRDKDELYLLCVKTCFDELTAALRQASQTLHGTAQQRLNGYFDARLRFFAEHPACLGLFAGVSFAPPDALRDRIAPLRRAFDDLNLTVLTGLLAQETLRPGLDAAQVVEEFGLFMDFFHTRFRDARRTAPPEEFLRLHEEFCHRQLDILLYGVVEGPSPHL